MRYDEDVKVKIIVIKKIFNQYDDSGSLKKMKLIKAIA